jgi:hypothetical protein
MDEACDGIDNDCDGLVDGADSNIDVSSAPTWYIDSDNDGYGNPNFSQAACDQPSGYVFNADDCNDVDASINPDTIWYADADSDGYGDSTSTTTACEQPAGYTLDMADCDDTDGAINPDTVWYADTDEDGYGSPSFTTTACEQPSGYLVDSSDCDDANSMINPDGSEICDGEDNNCDGAIDDADSTVDVATGFVFYEDSDFDGYGDIDSTTQACAAPAGYVSDASDCDDTDGAINPDTIWYADADSDDYGNIDNSTTSCSQPAGYILNSLDCNDFDATINPNITEVCDGDDNNCDTLVDDEDPQVDPSGFNVFFEDSDGDGYGLDTSTLSACIVPDGYAEFGGDCDDTDVDVFTGAAERCDSKDNDCDGVIDEDQQNVWYTDSDGDGFGDPLADIVDCDPPVGTVALGTDCNDSDAAINPDASEICDSIDNDCDTDIDDDDASLDLSSGIAFYADSDGDGYGDIFTVTEACQLPAGYSENSLDCNDVDMMINPGEFEACDDAIDNNCDTIEDTNLCDLGFSSAGARIYGAEGTWFGYSVSSAGDLNNDGTVDFIAGALADSEGGLYAGTVYAFYGPINGAMSSVDADVTMYGAVGDLLGGTVSGSTAYNDFPGVTGDLNNDGFDDIIMGAANNDLGTTDAGAIYVKFGPVSGTLNLSTEADLIYTGEGSGDKTVYGLNMAGDVNNDGFSDFIVGSFTNTSNGAGTGASYLIYGSDSLTGGSFSAADSILYGGNNDFLGYNLAAPGDVNGDGFNDILTNAYRADYTDPDTSELTENVGATYLMHGPLDASQTTADAAASIYGVVQSGQVGMSLSGAGDIDGDGKSDILLGSHLVGINNTKDGVVYLVAGDPSGDVVLSNATATFIGANGLDEFGRSSAGLGDLNNDGFDDIVIGAKKSDEGGQTDSGAAYLFFGPLSGTYNAPHAILAGESGGDQIGASLKGMPDMDGDNVSEILAGTTLNQTNGVLAGSAYIFFGGDLP